VNEFPVQATFFEIGSLCMHGIENSERACLEKKELALLKRKNFASEVSAKLAAGRAAPHLCM
jgi:hypothetical protein